MKRHNLNHPMSRRGNGHENAFAESVSNLSFSEWATVFGDAKMATASPETA